MIKYITVKLKMKSWIKGIKMSVKNYKMLRMYNIFTYLYTMFKLWSKKCRTQENLVRNSVDQVPKDKAKKDQKEKPQKKFKKKLNKKQKTKKPKKG